MIVVSNRDVWITTNYAPTSITVYRHNIVEARLEVTRINVLTFILSNPLMGITLFQNVTTLHNLMLLLHRHSHWVLNDILELKNFGRWDPRVEAIALFLLFLATPQSTQPLHN